jgi:hypothetical protein
MMVYIHQSRKGDEMNRAAVNTPGRLPGMPDQPKTPVRTLRVEDALWRAAQAKAKAEGRTLTGVITDYLKRYVSAPPRAKSSAKSE